MKVRLGDVATYINGYAFKPSDWSDHGKPIIRIQDLTGNSYQMNRFDGICDDKYNVRAGDVLISWSASLGVYVWQGEDAVLNQHIFKVVFNKEKLNKRFFVYQVGNILEKASSEAHGATMKHLTKPVFDALPFYLPEIKKQNEIAYKLDAVCDIIDKRDRQIQKLDELVKARFVEMFGDDESNPKGWMQSRIGDCCTLKSGTSLPVEVENEGGPIPYVKVGDMNYPGNERYITTSSRYVSSTTAGNGLFEVGSVLFPKRGGAIGTNKKRMTKLPICADLNIMGVSSNGALLPEYLLTYFDMIDLGTLSDGSSVPQINNKNIAPLLICLPPLQLQREFAAFVSQVDKSKTAIQSSLNQLETLKQSLMQKYFG